MERLFSFGWGALIGSLLTVLNLFPMSERTQVIELHGTCCEATETPSTPQPTITPASRPPPPCDCEVDCYGGVIALHVPDDPTP